MICALIPAIFFYLVTGGVGDRNNPAVQSREQCARELEGPHESSKYKLPLYSIRYSGNLFYF